MPKVLYIGFGISPFVRGGAVVYQEAIIKAVSASHGWQSVCFFSRPRYTTILTSKPYLKTWYKNKIKYLELCNAPYPLGCQNNPAEQCSQPDIEKLALKVLKNEKPDIVHFHELQTHPCSIIEIVSKEGIPSIKTMHNYYDICPQRDLMFKGTEPCLDFNYGKQCTECLGILPLRKKSSRKNIARTLLPDWGYRYIYSLYNTVKKSVRNSSNKMINSIKVTSYSSDQYLRRRHFFIINLNKLDAIHCSSPRSAQIFIDHGVSKEKIKLIPLSANSIEQISPKPLRNNHHPLVFGYISGRNISRGYEVLINAFSRLDQSKAKLIVWGASCPEMFNENLNVEFRKPYEHEQINEILKEIDIGVIPSIWEEIFGIIGVEWLTARIPIIGSDIGGIPSWLHNEENGFLVVPNDQQQLADKMDIFVQNPGLVAQIQQRMKPWKLFREHLNEIIALYEDTMINKSNANKK